MERDQTVALKFGEEQCDECAAVFVPSSRRQRYCDHCQIEREDRRVEDGRRRAREQAGVSLAPGLPTGHVGALAELLVTTDLLRRGYDVFRAVNPNASCDLIAVAGDDTIKIEVRASRRRASGVAPLPYERKDFGRQHILAVVIADEPIRYLAPVGSAWPPEWEDVEP